MIPSALRSVLLVVALLGGCSSDANDGPRCSCRPGEVCFEGRTCRAVCASDSTCTQGLRCLDYATTKVCQCDVSLCSDREDCVSPLLMCREVVCSERVPCLDKTAICDSFARRCLPESGDCSSDEVCPTLPIEADRYASMACDAVTRTCRVAARLAKATVASTSGLVGVTKPAPGTLFDPSEDPVFAWSPVDDALLVQVLREAPKTAADLPRVVIWAASVVRGGPSQLQWSQGHAVVAGSWIAGPPPAPPVGGFYLWVQAVRADRLVAASELVPFAVGSAAPWRVEGDLCATDGTHEGCESPAFALACVDGRCHKLCGSKADCATECGLPVKGIRYCVL